MHFYNYDHYLEPFKPFELTKLRLLFDPHLHLQIFTQLARRRNGHCQR